MPGKGPTQRRALTQLGFQEFVDEVDANTTYIGDSAQGTAEDAPGWRLRKVTVVGTVTKIQFAVSADADRGPGQYTERWDQRASLTYA